LKTLLTFAVLVITGICAASDDTSLRSKTVLEVLRESKRILWIAAHPDDENSSSALLARGKELSGTLFMASLTRGENSDIVWSGLRRGSAMGTARSELFAKSMAILKADAYDVGPFVNGPYSLAELDARPANAPHQDWLPKATSSADVIAKWKREGDPLGYVIKLVRERRPDVVVSLDDYCGGSGHPEHIAVARLLLQAIPLAADPSAYPGVGEPWKVHAVIFSAHIIPQLVACQFCKCEGKPPTVPAETVLTVERSRVYDMTYLGVKCVVAKTYQNAMQTKGWTETEIREGCRKSETLAGQVPQGGAKEDPLFEQYRIRLLNSQ